MGSRLGVIVQTESGSEIYYDHWAAQAIGGGIALDGFDATLHRVRQMEPMGVDTPHDWKGAVWIEGTLLIDLRSKTVVWAEESEGLYLPRLINALVERTWPGWTAIWSPEGTRGTLWAAGVDPASLFTSTAYRTRTMEGDSWFGPWGEFNPVDAFSAVLEDGELLRWRGEGVLDVIAELGPINMRRIAAETLERSRAGELLLWDDQPRDERPYTGVHIDFRERSLRWWSLMDDDMGIEAFYAQWPGWVIESMGDNFEWHERLIQRELRSWKEDVQECREFLQREIDEGERQNPLMNMASRMAQAGEKIAISSTALKFVPSKRVAGSASALALLDELEQAQPLPPARFINRDGRVTPPLLPNENEPR